MALIPGESMSLASLPSQTLLGAHISSFSSTLHHEVIQQDDLRSRCAVADTFNPRRQIPKFEVSSAYLGSCRPTGLHSGILSLFKKKCLHKNKQKQENEELTRCESFCLRPVRNKSLFFVNYQVLCNLL